MLQRSNEWRQARHGKFTASEIHKLMGIKALGETGKTYAIEKAIEQLYGDMEESFISYDMQHGIDLEPLAFAKFKALKAEEFIQVDNCSFFINCDDSGASPDGIMSDGVVEIKCPKSTTFFKLVADGEISKNYFFQMQMQMMCANVSKAHFFNYMVHDGEEYWHEIIIDRDDAVIELMQQRIKEAVIIKNEYIEKINNNKQF